MAITCLPGKQLVTEPHFTHCRAAPTLPRRECLDHVLILGRRHLLHVLREYAFEYFNGRRPHQGIAQQVPVPAKRASYGAGADVVATPVLGGLHNHYPITA